jgi:UDPglucose 6-dehydrogenase
VQSLISRGAGVRSYDPAAMSKAQKLLPEVQMCQNEYEACQGADALVIITEWNQFRMLDLERVKGLLRTPVVIDLRNVYEPEPMRAAGFAYTCVGRI